MASETTDRSAPEPIPYTIPELEWIATEATRRLREIYQHHGWTGDTKVSPGTVRAVLDAAARYHGGAHAR